MSRRIDNCVVISSVVLLIALSFEIVLGNHIAFTPYYVALEGVVCSTYITKFFIDLNSSKSKSRFWAHRFPILLISIPYVAIVWALGLKIDREVVLLLGMLPILRAIISFYRLFIRLVTAQSVDKIFLAYLIVTILITYIASLIFYDCEFHNNTHLHSFGDAVWWAWMSLTTVGAAIYPITTIGKILSVLLPLMGMMLLPLFTSYIIAIHKRRG